MWLGVISNAVADSVSTFGFVFAPDMNRPEAIRDSKSQPRLPSLGTKTKGLPKRADSPNCSNRKQRCGPSANARSSQGTTTSTKAARHDAGLEKDAGRS